jgi:PelA/Pel-15E family pectate lyase
MRLSIQPSIAILCILTCCFCQVDAQTSNSNLMDEARAALKKATTAFHASSSSHGGYVYYTSTDFKDRWGEGKVGSDTILVQPPGTPTVGMAFLKAYEATQDKFYLELASDAADAIRYGQLQSGGWTQVIHFSPNKNIGKYRNGKGGSWNASSLDDNQTQAALNFLILADQAFGFKRAETHEAATFGLDALLNAQFANGAFPQVWTAPVPKKPVFKSSFPTDDWRTEGRIKKYWDYYTLNDGLAGTVSETLMTAHRVYRDEKYLRSLKKLGDFLVLAQLPEPQPAWCQQYNYEMVPIWARKFEPPAIATWESQDVMDTLIKIAMYTGEKKYLEPISPALKYFEDGFKGAEKMPRYLEFKSNKPLFMNEKYELTYDDSKVPGHYGWYQSSRLKLIEERWLSAQNEKMQSTPKKVDEKEIAKIISELDSNGLWVSTFAGESLVGQPKFPPKYLYISSDVFSRNVTKIAEYLKKNPKGRSVSD